MLDSDKFFFQGFLGMELPNSVLVNVNIRSGSCLDANSHFGVSWGWTYILQVLKIVPLNENSHNNSFILDYIPFIQQGFTMLY